MPRKKTASKSRQPPAASSPKRRLAPRRRTAAQGKVGKTLPGAKTGRASAFAPAEGDAPVRAYIASLPPTQRTIAERFDAIMAQAIPGIRRCIKWGMSFYGTDTGWFVSCGGFVDHVKITFLHGTKLDPVPPVGTGKYTRGVDVERVGDLDASQLTAWLQQARCFPGLGAGRKKARR
jgi:hypothetical protein